MMHPSSCLWEVSVNITPRQGATRLDCGEFRLRAPCRRKQRKPSPAELLRVRGVEKGLEKQSETLLASKFPADYTVFPYANTSKVAQSPACLESTRCVATGLCADSGGNVADRAVHCDEGQTNHATGVGNVVRAGIVAINVTFWLN